MAKRCNKFCVNINEDENELISDLRDRGYNISEEFRNFLKDLHSKQDSFTVYMIKNIITGKMYIGQTKLGISGRRASHEYDALERYKISDLYDDMRELGIDKFEWCALETCSSRKEAISIEGGYIKKYNTFENGYNATTGGGCLITEKVKEKMRIKAFRRGIKVCKVMSPDGIVYETIDGIRRFAEQHNINVGNFGGVCSGRKEQTEGWTLVKDE